MFKKGDKAPPPEAAAAAAAANSADTEALIAQHQALITRLSDKHDAELEAIRGRESAAAAEAATAKAQVRQLEAAVTESERDRSAEAKLIKRLNTEKAELEASLAAAEAEVAKGEQREATLQARMQKLAAESSDAQFELQRARKQLAEVQAGHGSASDLALELRKRAAAQADTIETLQTAARDAALERDRYRADAAAAAGSLELQGRELERYKADVVATAKATAATAARIAALEADLASAREAAAVAGEEVVRYQQQLVARVATTGETEIRLAQVERARAGLVKQVEALQAGREADAVAAAGMLAAKEQEVASLSGAVRDLAARLRAMTIDSESGLASEAQARADQDTLIAGLRAALTARDEALAQGERERAELGRRLSAEGERVTELKTSVGVLVADLARCEAEARAALAAKDGAWAPNESATRCPGCGEAFGMLRRRHHCRVCGGLYCHACSAEQVTTPKYPSPVRACDACVEGMRESVATAARRRATSSALR